MGDDDIQKKYPVLRVVAHAAPKLSMIEWQKTILPRSNKFRTTSVTVYRDVDRGVEGLGETETVD